MSSGTQLDRILAQTRADLVLRRSATEMRLLERRAAGHCPRGFAAALRTAAGSRPAVIAELKKASPSRGLIRESFDPEALARSLEAGGAACLSVLTDEPFFQGSLHNLEAASAASTLPCLRKDFIVDEFQIIEALAHGADAILLIAAALTDAELRTLREAAGRNGLDVLCEVHDHAELKRVLPLECEMVGVNCRDLRTFTVDTREAERLASFLPKNVIRVAESGLHTAGDIARMHAAGYNAFLIGESLMRAAEPGEALKELLGAPESFRTPSGLPSHSEAEGPASLPRLASSPLVKA